MRKNSENRIWARANVRRLEAEVIRDTLLAVWGGLNRSVGAPPQRKPGEHARSHRQASYLMTHGTDIFRFHFLDDAADPENVFDQ